MADSRSNAIPDGLVAEYDQVNNNIRALADIRFKLLALVPALAGVGAALLSDDPRSPRTAVLALAGFVATFGVVAYDQRNSELYNSLIGRAKFLECKLDLPAARGHRGGQFSERPFRGRRLFGLLLGHDTALAMIYGVSLAAWVFPLVRFLIGLRVPAAPAPVWVERLPGIFGKQPWAPPLMDRVALGVTVGAFALFWGLLVLLDAYPQAEPRWLARWFFEDWLGGGNRQQCNQQSKEQLEKQISKYVANSFTFYPSDNAPPIVGKEFVERIRRCYPDLTVSLASDDELKVARAIGTTSVKGRFTTRSRHLDECQGEATVWVGNLWPRRIERVQCSNIDPRLLSAQRGCFGPVAEHAGPCRRTDVYCPPRRAARNSGGWKSPGS
jgi:hypothetical protein